ncbi:MAG: hypothetical protein HWE16_09700 [Gammaproteobacteria bacterium]|nr:hypothetical protein [Gammaproteobacteria bacterium]
MNKEVFILVACFCLFGCIKDKNLEAPKVGEPVISITFRDIEDHEPLEIEKILRNAHFNSFTSNCFGHGNIDDKGSGASSDDTESKDIE